jgi:outer membrane protein
MRFYKIKFFMAFFLIFAFAISSNAADVAKIGVVDIKRVLDNSTAGKEAQAELTKQGKKMQGELEKRKAEIEEIQKNIERQAAVMSKDAREQKKRDLQIKLYDFKNIENKYRSELRISEREKSIKIQKEVLRIAREIGKKEGYLIIIDKSIAIYVPNTLDLTDKVIQEYNAGYKK